MAQQSPPMKPRERPLHVSDGDFFSGEKWPECAHDDMHAVVFVVVKPHARRRIAVVVNHCRSTVQAEPAALAV
jgi:hypothetical protein